MLLKEIEIVNFRGFSKKTKINLDSKLVIIQGPNGHGKTSLAEAIEWLFFGMTKRRISGEKNSMMEYKGSFGNVHSAEEIIEVSAEVQFPDGSIKELKRRGCSKDEESLQTFIDGTQADFSKLGNMDDSFYPVIAQHALQDFINCKPKDRRDEISKALGLEEITLFKTTLDNARRLYCDPLGLDTGYV
ncbi:AAA family ATPase [candidate division WOR-3 bacterium]|uniref:AAA family ATPase n=1 Tax=candidate division WOR-3 bacterium TaxID=2052148 RepID=A0A9D5K7T6_UNCW3|nr:AAA family ATPase [candidate division WOR-3 bacterium]MBD3363857.1 AAA family ATPase [candidate division WOR-3 bacterium]